MAKVSDDPRHTDVCVLRRDQITAREFSHWSMGFGHIANERACEIPGFTDYLLTGQIDGSAARRHATATFHRVFRDHMREPLRHSPG